MKINLLDLFSGIGGFHLGLSQAGFKVNSYYSEVDKYAIKTYNHNFKNSTYVGSVTDVQGAELPRINAITFGSPCQDFSLAGKRKGMEGSRSSLILEAIRLIEECRPDFFIWENVKGTFSSNNRQDFAAILQAFTNIGGYRLEWQLLNTKWFLPQNRERIYLVGYAPNRSRGQVFPIGENCFKNIKLQRQQGNTCTLTTRYEAGGNGSYIIERELDAQEEIKVKSATKKGYEIAITGDSVNLSQPNSKTRRGRVGKQQAQTLETSCNQAVINPLIRRLTPIECERLQGFPDNWTLAEDNSDTQRYKMCGNAVTVDVVREVAKRIKKTLYWT
jgi:DNA (cytosine-5)-methyltransferase 1